MTKLISISDEQHEKLTNLKFVFRVLSFEQVVKELLDFYLEKSEEERIGSRRNNKEQA